MTDVHYREGKEKESGGEITDLRNSVFAGQIFAEMLAGIRHKEFYNQSDQEVGIRDIYYIYFVPTLSCQLQQIYDTRNLVLKIEGMTLSSTKLYDFSDPVERAQWLDILLALIEYLRSESKVGFLNKFIRRNMLHKSQEDAGGLEGSVVKAESIPNVVGEIPSGGYKNNGAEESRCRCEGS